MVKRSKKGTAPVQATRAAARPAAREISEEVEGETDESDGVEETTEEDEDPEDFGTSEARLPPAPVPPKSKTKASGVSKGGKYIALCTFRVGEKVFRPSKAQLSFDEETALRLLKAGSIKAA